ncbi:MAG: hypothetical protein II998_02720 [Clostridia bacterium]|nr:hypothetical protein [Clostridia bacterium]
MHELSTMIGLLTAASFVVNIIVQMTKNFVPIPTKLWCITVSATVSATALLVANANNYIKLTPSEICLSLISSFVVAYVAMYGFDAAKELWRRLHGGENINDD